MMGRISDIANIIEGDILSEPVLNNFGQVLVPSGAKLTERHINLLRTWNIKTVVIAGESVEEEDFSDELIKAGLEVIAPRMQWSPRNAAERELLSLGIYCVIKQMQKGARVDGY